jgi:hypothetical protein
MDTRRQAGHLQLKAPRGPGFGLHQAGEGQGRLLGEALERGKVLLRQAALHQHALGQAGAVPEDHEAHLAAGAQMGHPTPEGDDLSHMAIQVSDGQVTGCIYLEIR